MDVTLHTSRSKRKVFERLFKGLGGGLLACAISGSIPVDFDRLSAWLQPTSPYFRREGFPAAVYGCFWQVNHPVTSQSLAFHPGGGAFCLTGNKSKAFLKAQASARSRAGDDELPLRMPKLTPAGGLQ